MTAVAVEKQDKGQERRQECRERLERQVAELVGSDEWRRWLECRAVFHDYSFGNVLLIVSQRPSASRVAGFKAWKKVGRSVMKGEKGIWIWAPMMVRDRESSDPEARTMIFRPVPVFDVSQTDGEPLPELEREPLTGSSHEHYLEPLEAFAGKLGRAVEYVPAGELGGAGGTCSEKLIRVRAELEPNARVRVLLHELAHALGVHYARFPGDEGEGDRFPRDVAEVMVESAAFVTATSIGLDTSCESVPYVAGWADGSPERIRAVAARVDELAARLERACGLEGAREVSL